MRERKIDLEGRKAKELKVKASRGKSRSFIYDRKRICVTTPNVDVNKVRKEKIRRERARKMKNERKKKDDEQRQGEIIRIRDKVKGDKAKEQGSKRAFYRASICRKG